jgi:hypothetical protein
MNKATLVAVVLLLVVAAGAMVVNRSLRVAQERPAVQRLESQSRLRQFAAAIAAYRDHHGAWPSSLAVVIRDAHLGLGANAVRGGGVYRYRCPPADAGGGYVVMWSELNHAGIKRGEPWGGEGQVADRDIPAVAYILDANLNVEELDLDEFARRAPRPIGGAD